MGWFMGLGAKLFGLLAGPIGYGLAIVAVGTLAFDRWDLYTAKLEERGYGICTAEYMKAEKKAASEKAQKEAETANALLEAERETAGGLRDELERITGEYQTLAAELAAKPSNDPARCLSDGMLTRLGRVAKPAGQLEGAKEPAAGNGKPGS